MHKHDAKVKIPCEHMNDADFGAYICKYKSEIRILLC